MSQLRLEQLAGMNIHYRLYPLEHFLDTQQRLGITTIELWAGAPHFLLGYDGFQDCTKLKQLLRERGMTIGAFSPECVTYPFPVCSGQPQIRQLGRAYYENAIRAAAGLGAKIVPISCAGALKDEDLTQAVDRAAEGVRELGALAGELGVTLAVETLCPDASPVLNTLDQLEAFLRAVDHPQVKACLDICSVRVAGETLQQWFECLGDQIVHVHFTDGRPGGHLVWGQGLHPLDDYVDTLARNGYQGLLGLNLNLRGTWFDPSLTDEERGFVGTDFIPDNYWFCPSAVDQQNLEALAGYFARSGGGAVI